MIEALASLHEISADGMAEALASGPLLRLLFDGERPRAAAALMAVNAPAEVLWSIVGNIDSFPKLINMVHSVRHLDANADGVDVVKVNLRFKMAFFSTKFDFVATRETTGERRVEVNYVSGKVRDVAIEIEVLDIDAEHSVLRCHVGFDPLSLGWLVKVFLRHHPEIEWGLHTGSVMSIASAACAAAEKQWSARG
jgi:ribosome-associated toxin RatA of RatAB toxin-antitoxin module